MSEISDSFWNQAFNELNTSDGWTSDPLSEDEKKYQLAVFKKKITLDKSQHPALKIHVQKISYPVDLVFESWKDITLRPKYAENTVDAKVLEEGDSSDVIYYEIAPPSSMVSHRDFCLARKWKKTDNGYQVVGKSINHKSAPSKKGVVRATMHLQVAEFVKSGDNSTDVKIISSQEFGGWIPSSAIAALARKAPAKLPEHMDKACKLMLEKKKQ